MLLVAGFNRSRGQFYARSRTGKTWSRRKASNRRRSRRATTGRRTYSRAASNRRGSRTTRCGTRGLQPSRGRAGSTTTRCATRYSCGFSPSGSGSGDSRSPPRISYSTARGHASGRPTRGRTYGSGKASSYWRRRGCYSPDCGFITFSWVRLSVVVMPRPLLGRLGGDVGPVPPQPANTDP